MCLYVCVPAYQVYGMSDFLMKSHNSSHHRWMISDCLDCLASSCGQGYSTQHSTIYGTMIATISSWALACLQHNVLFCSLLLFIIRENSYNARGTEVGVGGYWVERGGRGRRGCDMNCKQHHTTENTPCKISRLMLRRLAIIPRNKGCCNLNCKCKLLTQQLASQGNI